MRTHSIESPKGQSVHPNTLVYTIILSLQNGYTNYGHLPESPPRLHLSAHPEKHERYQGLPRGGE